MASQLPLSIPADGSDVSDIALLRQIAGTVENVARHIDPATCAPPPYVVRHASDAGFVRRIVLYHRPDYLLQRACTFVGFLGKKRSLLSARLVRDMVAADERLMDEMVGHVDLLGYASLELADRNWCGDVIRRASESEGKMPRSRETPIQKAERLVREAVARVARDHSPEAYDWLDVVKLNLAVCHTNHADFQAHYRRIVLGVSANAPAREQRDVGARKLS